MSRRRGGKQSPAEEESGPPKEDFYELLGVAKDATPAQIKRAFRDAAVKHHPDKGGDVEMFKKIKEASDVLSDAEKREVYDQYGHEGLERMQNGGRAGGGDFSAEDLLSQIFGGGGRRGPQGPQKPQPTGVRLDVTLEDLYNGKDAKIEVKRRRLCMECSGRGTNKPNVQARQCGECDGRGVTMAVRMIGLGMYEQVPMKCQKCTGTGRLINPADRCGKCNGAKIFVDDATLDVRVERGMVHKQQIPLEGEGDQIPDAETGDVIAVLFLAPHERFERQGDHLIFKQKISLADALCGCRFAVEHLDGRTLDVSGDRGKVIKHGDLKTIEGEGMPRTKNYHLKGDLVVKFEIDFPEGFTEEQVEALEKLLPPRPAVDVPADAERVRLSKFNEHLFDDDMGHRGHGHAHGMHDDDEDGPAGGPQCRAM